jgi:hypothetical protein
MNHGYGLATQVRVGIALGWHAMSGPAGMSNTDEAIRRYVVKRGLQLTDFALAANPYQLIRLIENGHPSGIISAIF